MAIADVPTHRAGLFPEARIETTSLPAVGWGLRGRGLPGRGAGEAAAAGESVLRILEVMSRAVLYNTRSAFFRHPSPPPSAPPPASRLISARITAGLMKNGNSYPSVLPSTLFYILTLDKNSCFATKTRYNV